MDPAAVMAVFRNGWIILKEKREWLNSENAFLHEPPPTHFGIRHRAEELEGSVSESAVQTKKGLIPSRFSF
jgi:hypothetical protein